MARCADCGAVTDAVACSELFDVLLALDHSRRRPWGPLHAVATAAYLLQHPSDPRARTGSQDAAVMLVEAHVHGGQRALSEATEHVRRTYRTGTSTTTTGLVGARSPRPGAEALAGATVSIHDVAIDGTFPAAGYQDRVHRWAGAVAHASSGER